MTTTQSDYCSIPHWLQKQAHSAISESKVVKPSISTAVDLDSQVEEVKDWLDKGIEQGLCFVNISEKDLEALVSKLAEQGIKARYDWSDGEVPTAVFRMASLIHERPGAWFADQKSKISERLSQMALCGSPQISFAANFTFKMHGKNPKRTPDQALMLHTSFGPNQVHSPARPRIVLETACSQTLESVMEKTWEYLYCCNQEIHAVIVCKLNCPITSTRDFHAKIGVWIRKPTDNDEEDFPEDKFPYAHELSGKPLELDGEQQEDDLPDMANSLASSSEGSKTASVESEGTTRVEDFEDCRYYTAPKQSKEIWRRSEKPIVVYQEAESEPEGQKATLLPQSLVLDGYDILRVCSQHLDATIAVSEIDLPLDELRDIIKITVDARRAEILGARQAKKSSGEQRASASRPAKRQRK